MSNKDERELTPMAHSIYRRQQEIDRLRSEEFKIIGPAKTLLSNLIKLLENQICADNIMLSAERKMIEEAHLSGQSYAVASHRDFKQIHPNEKEYFKTKYRQE